MIHHISLSQTFLLQEVACTID